MDSKWSAAGYLNSAKTLPAFYHWLAGSQNIAWVNLINEWGIMIIGVALILGIFTRWASLGGILLMILYYLPILRFPYVGQNSFLVDDHIIYILVFVFFFFFRAGGIWGLDGFLQSRGIFRRKS